MVIKTKRIPITGELMGRHLIEKIRQLYGDDMANKVKLINEISFHVPVYNADFPTKDVVEFYIPETNEWYLEFPEEITINT